MLAKDGGGEGEGWVGVMRSREGEEYEEMERKGCLLINGVKENGEKEEMVR